MIPPLSGESSDALDRALDLLRIRLLAAAASSERAGNHPPSPCRSTGAPRRRNTGTAA